MPSRRFLTTTIAPHVAPLGPSYIAMAVHEPFISAVSTLPLSRQTLEIANGSARRATSTRCAYIFFQRSLSTITNMPQVAHPRRPASLLSPLFQVLDTSIPTEFHLPDDIKSFFKDGAPLFHSHDFFFLIQHFPISRQRRERCLHRLFNTQATSAQVCSCPYNIKNEA